MKNSWLLCFGLLIYTANATAATILVNTTNWTVNEDDGLCTLYEAVDAANLNVASGVTPGECVAGDAYVVTDPIPAVDEITFDQNLFPAYIPSYAPFELVESVRIVGPGQELMSIASFGFARVFVIKNVLPAVNFEISGMTLRDSTLYDSNEPGDDSGAAILGTISGGGELLLLNMRFYNNSSERGGGAIYLTGQTSDNLITIRNCTFENNFVVNIDATTIAGGGAIFIGGNQNVVIENSSFFGNYTDNAAFADPQNDAAGGAILMRSSSLIPSTLKITRSTFSNNRTTGLGGAIALGGSGQVDENSELTLKHSTITLNQADSNNDYTGNNSWSGGGLYSSSLIPATIFNTIIAQNTDLSDTPAADLHGAMDSTGYNFIGDNSGAHVSFPAGQPNGNDDWVGTAAAVLPPNLEVLADWGGPTLTHRPKFASLTIDQGSCTPQVADQRYFNNNLTGKRIVDSVNYSNADDGCDIGAVELNAESTNSVPIAVDDSYDVLEGQLLSINAATGLLSNDIDDDPLLVVSAGLTAATGDVVGEADVAANGSFTYSADDVDANGLSTFTYQISDGSNSDEGSVLITVIAVNDAPQFDAATTAIETTKGQPYTYPSWATNISSGPANEAGQTLQFVFTPVAVPANFFSSLPAVNTATGQLSFTINANATGSAQVKVVLQDNGGMANGGINKSAEVLLTIEVGAPPANLIFQNGFEQVF